MPTGVRLYALMRSNNDRPFYFHFGDQPITYIICGKCLKASNIKSLTLDKVVLHMYNHWCSTVEGSATMPPHPLSSRRTRGEIREALAVHYAKLPGGIQGWKSKGAYLVLEAIAEYFGAGDEELKQALTSMDRKQIRACNRCLTEIEGTRIGCCGDSSIIEVTGVRGRGLYSLPLIAWTPNISPEVVQKSLWPSPLPESAARAQVPYTPSSRRWPPSTPSAGDWRTLGVAPPGMMSMSASATSHSGNMLIYNSAQSNSSPWPSTNRQGYMPPSPMPRPNFGGDHQDWPMLYVDTPSVKRRLEDIKSVAMPDGRFAEFIRTRPSAMGITLAVARDSEFTNVYRTYMRSLVVDVGDETQSASTSAPKRVALESTADVSSRQQITRLLTGGETHDSATQLRYAKMHSIKLSNSRDCIIQTIAEKICSVFSITYAELGRSVELQAIGKAPAIAAITQVVDTDPIKARAFSEFAADKSTISRRAKYCAEYLKLLSSLDIRNYSDKVERAVQSINVQLGINGVTVQNAEYTTAVMLCITLLQDIAFDKVGNFTKTLPAFAYSAKDVNVAGGKADDADSDEEDDFEDDRFVSTDASPESVVAPTTPSNGQQMLKCLMHIFKGALAVWLRENAIQLEAAGETFNQTVEATIEYLRVRVRVRVMPNDQR